MLSTLAGCVRDTQRHWRRGEMRQIVFFDAAVNESIKGTSIRSQLWGKPKRHHVKE